MTAAVAASPEHTACPFSHRTRPPAMPGCRPGPNAGRRRSPCLSAPCCFIASTWTTACRCMTSCIMCWRRAACSPPASRASPTASTRAAISTPGWWRRASGCSATACSPPACRRWCRWRCWSRPCSCWLRATAGRGAAWTAALLFARLADGRGHRPVRPLLRPAEPGLLPGRDRPAPGPASAPAAGPHEACSASPASALLLLAVQLQDTTLLGIVGLGLWAVLACGLPWLARPGGAGAAARAGPARRHRWRHRRARRPVGSAASSASSGSAIAGRRCSTRAAADRFWFYHAWLNLYYPTLWPAVGLLSLLALVARRRARPAGPRRSSPRPSCSTRSPGRRSLRYLAYGFPFLFALWGIGLAALWPRLRACRPGPGATRSGRRSALTGPGAAGSASP